MLVLLLLLFTIPLPQKECTCTYPLKTNITWCVGTKGGQYCINSKGTKTYKPKL